MHAVVTRRIKIMKKMFLGLVASMMALVGLAAIAPAAAFPTQAESLTPNLYSKLAVAICAPDTNSFETNRNPQIFDSENQAFIDAVSARKDVETLASSIETSSAYDFSRQYATTFSSSIDSSVSAYMVSTDVSSKFQMSEVGASFQQRIERFEYYYWFTQKYIVNIDWGAPNLDDALASGFKRELEALNGTSAAKQFLKKYGTHVYDTYVLGGKLEITKYFVQDASYEMTETEKSMAASLSVIINTAKVDAKVSGSVDFTAYESNSATSSKVFTKLDYHAYGGDSNGAVHPADLFQYKPQFGTGTASGFLYEAWTNSFNDDNADLKVVSAQGSRPIWDLLDPTVYGSQIAFLKKAFDNLCFQSYAENCEEFGVPCDYFSSLDYMSAGTRLSVTPYEAEINLPENTDVAISLSSSITDEFESDEYAVQLSSTGVAQLNGNVLSIGTGTIGRSFDIELYIQDMKAYALRVTVKKEGYSGGYGSAQQPFEISTKSDVIAFFANFENSGGHYRLSNDIDLGGEKIDVGGSATGDAFMGVFDGNDHALRNFTVKASAFTSDAYTIGLFGQNEGVIKNLVIDGVRVLLNGVLIATKDGATVNCGILVGLNSGVINNCRVKNSSLRVPAILDPETAVVNVGGIVGQSQSLVQYSMIQNSRIDGIFDSGKGLMCVGGLVGRLIGATLEKSYVSDSWIYANTSDDAKYSLGGLVGRMESTATEQQATIRPMITTCLVYGLTANKSTGNFGYVAGSSVDGGCSSCYYAAKSELSISSARANGCVRKTSLTLETIANSSFDDEWEDGASGPVLKKHNDVQ